MKTRAILSVTAVSIAMVLTSATPHRPRLVWNASASAPIGLYAVFAASRIARQDLVLALPPPAAQRLAAERGYLPRGIPLIKRVAALGGDRICADELRVAINGVEAAIRLPWDGQGRPLPAWRGCRMLSADDVFLLNGSILHSFDGRYFGPVSRSAIVGKLRPLWLL
jgi:conjugative transfer signal peptidase TraF